MKKDVITIGSITVKGQSKDCIVNGYYGGKYQNLSFEDCHDATFNFRQVVEVNGIELDTFWQRIKWIIKGK